MLLALPRPVVAQSGSTSGAQRASRADLAALLATHEQKLTGSQLKPVDRNKLMAAVAALRGRLTRGDFQVGDRFIVTIRRDTVRADTVSVRDSMMINLANLPDVSLSGVLRSELDDRLNTYVARYLRSTTVRTSVLTRVAIIGQVARPGFYYLSPDRPVSDVVMAAGGPTPDADLSQLEIRRGQVTTLEKKESRGAMKAGQTFEQLDVQSGDEVSISAKRKINWQLVIQTFLIFSTLLFSGLQFLQWYYNRKAQ